MQLGVLAEQAGFDLLATSDHFHHGNPMKDMPVKLGYHERAWRTYQKVWIGPTVTCPTFRYNPAVVAEAFAPLSLLYPGRIFLGVGSGEALNEEAATGSWPKWLERSSAWSKRPRSSANYGQGSRWHSGKYYN